MRKLHINNYLLFFFISFIFTVYFVGLNNFWFTKVDWLYGSGDYTNSQLSWQYFQNDEWRFPFGKNPNYGIEIANSIVFTDNIPLLAFLFKTINIFNFGKIQYFSFWIFISFFLQFYFSYKILFEATNNNTFAILGSFIFSLCPFFLMRLSHHFALGGHWLILYSFYIAYFLDEKDKNYNWYLIITLSLLIHFYFTAMIFVIYSCFLLEKIINQKKVLYLKSLLYKIFFTCFLMYLIGYFESSTINSISRGYGEYKLDLLGFFDPQINAKPTWSLFLKDLPSSSLESFNYLGFGNLILLASAILLFIFNYNKKILDKSQTKVFRISNLLK